MKMAKCDRSHTTFYWSAMVNIALSCTIFSYITLNNIATLKSGLEVIQGHSNWYHSNAWGGFLFAFHSNYGRILTVYEILSVKEWHDLENGDRGGSRSLKMAPFDRSLTTQFLALYSLSCIQPHSVLSSHLFP